jgi:hypothetical protein
VHGARRPALNRREGRSYRQAVLLGVLGPLEVRVAIAPGIRLRASLSPSELHGFAATVHKLRTHVHEHRRSA